MPSRRSHPKTRLGCIQCKRRRIKCDEKRPACDRCVKRGTQCTFDNTFVEYPAATPKPEETGQSGTPNAVAAAAGYGSYGYSCAVITPPVSSVAPMSTVPDMQTLELMHHFATHTCLTVSSKEKVQRVWQHELPKVALSYDWLMQGLLCVAALDLARLSAGESDRYLNASMRYQNLALRSFTPLLSHMSQQNCHAMFAFSSMTVMSVMAYHQIKMGNSQEDCLSETIKFFRLCRGAAGIVKSEHEYIRQGVFASMMQIESPDTPVELSTDVRNALAALRALSNSSTNAQPLKDALADTIMQVERSWELSVVNPNDHAASFVFPTQVTDKYMELLKAKEPVSLLVLAHYAATLHHVRHYWWIGNWARHLIDAIANELGDSWTEHLEWPRRAIFAAES